MDLKSRVFIQMLQWHNTVLVSYYANARIKHLLCDLSSYLGGLHKLAFWNKLLNLYKQNHKNENKIMLKWSWFLSIECAVYVQCVWSYPMNFMTVEVIWEYHHNLHGSSGDLGVSPLLIAYLVCWLVISIT